METFYYGNQQADTVLIQMADSHDMDEMEQEFCCIREQVKEKDFLFVAVLVDSWNRDLSPWYAPAVFGNEDFGDGAARTLSYLTEELLPSLEGAAEKRKKEFYIGGYSLAGLFALWSVYQTDRFLGAAAVSPSVWFPGFRDYCKEHPLLADRIYLSLGDREEKTRNRVMAQVGNAIRGIHEDLDRQGVSNVLEWNPGNHFRDPGKRTAKGFAWLLQHEKPLYFA